MKAADEATNRAQGVPLGSPGAAPVSKEKIKEVYDKTMSSILKNTTDPMDQSRRIKVLDEKRAALEKIVETRSKSHEKARADYEKISKDWEREKSQNPSGTVPSEGLQRRMARHVRRATELRDLGESEAAYLSNMSFG